ncbi:MAG: hypothetical protein AVDCRST_MAG56-1041, partial [uncultured Cytophagales bacterium]
GHPDTDHGSSNTDHGPERRLRISARRRQWDTDGIERLFEKVL